MDQAANNLAPLLVPNLSIAFRPFASCPTLTLRKLFRQYPAEVRLDEEGMLKCGLQEARLGAGMYRSSRPGNIPASTGRGRMLRVDIHSDDNDKS